MSEIVEFKKLEQYRSKKGMTYAELANELSVPENYIYRWRQKKEIKGAYARLIKMQLGIK
jgi:transcriptional regulator with XRE-family HTH domain